jgi:hypothetical protein
MPRALLLLPGPGPFRLRQIFFALNPNLTSRLSLDPLSSPSFLSANLPSEIFILEKKLQILIVNLDHFFCRLFMLLALHPPFHVL